MATSCGWRREQSRLRVKSHCQPRHPAVVALLELRLERLRTHSSRWLDGNRELWLFKQLSGFGLTVAAWLCLQPSSALVLSQSLGPPAEVGSGRQQKSCLPRAASARAADGAWVLPSEMIWDTESLFQYSHLWWFEVCGCGGAQRGCCC